MQKSRIENPLNRMVIEDRKRKKYGKATGIFSVALGADVLAMAIISRNDFSRLVTLSAGRVSTGNFVLLDVIGAAAAILMGFLLLEFKHFSKISFAITCAVAIFFGLMLPFLEVLHSPSSLVSVLTFEGAAALVLTGVVMVLSLFSA